MHLFFFLFFLVAVSGEVYFSENFADNASLDSWVPSTFNEDKQGQFIISAGPSPIDPVEDLGLTTSEDYRFYGISKSFTPFSNKGKTLVLQYTVKNLKTVSCAGAYIKLLPAGIDGKKFHGESPYLIMFGPDICGPANKKVHVIFNYKSKNHLIKKEIPCKDDLNTHLYTLIVTSDNKYKVKIDNKEVESGILEDDWDFLPPKKIKDPKVSKPQDWDDREKIEDINDKKPDDWDQPTKISDPNAKKPEDWDDEMDGEWEAPQVDNPNFKGEWTPKMIDNPQYKGEWIHPEIDNPDYQTDPNLYSYENIGGIGFDLWQVESQSIFDNILLTDSPDYAEKQGELLWKKRYDAEAARKDVEEEKKIDEPKASDVPEADGGDDKDTDDDTHDEL